MAGLISLSLPLGIQSLIGFLTAGQASTSIVVLTILILLGVVLVGLFQIFQMSITEFIKQRIFLRVSFAYARAFPRIDLQRLSENYSSEWANRFFDVLTLQKGFSKMLIDFSGAVLQTLFGLILLALYHPYFIIFGVFLVGILIVLFALTGPPGLRTSLKESSSKYIVAAWLQTIARSMATLKMSSGYRSHEEKLDHYVTDHLSLRQKHFKILLVQYYAFIGFKAIVTAALLILGTVLIINKEINIGQFVASEIVIILIIGAIEKMILSLDTVYDVLTSLEKVEVVTDLPQEELNEQAVIPADSNSTLLELNNVSYRIPSSGEEIVKSVSLTINSGDIICITAGGRSGRKTLAHLMIGFKKPSSGTIRFLNTDSNLLDRGFWFSRTADNVVRTDFLEGSVLENITMGCTSSDNARINDALDLVGIRHAIESLQHGLNTNVSLSPDGFSYTTLQRLSTVRAVLTCPDLLILDDLALGMNVKEKNQFVERLIRNKPFKSLILFSNEEDIISQCSRVFELKQGALVFNGTSEEYLKMKRN